MKQLKVVQDKELMLTRLGKSASIVISDWQDYTGKIKPILRDHIKRI